MRVRFSPKCFVQDALTVLKTLALHAHVRLIYRNISKKPCGIFSDIKNWLSFDPCSCAVDKLKILFKFPHAYVKAFHNSQKKKTKAQEKADNFSPFT